MLIVWRDL